MNLLVSAVICTHNPKIHYLKRVLEALREQTLSIEVWELILIDNASNFDWNSEIDLSWHPNHYCFREEQLGVMYARLRGMREFNTNLVVFVDDDNILYPDYLETTTKISHDYPQLGLWGGQSIAEFEEQPPDWTKPYWSYLAIREFESNQCSYSFSSPVQVISAGGCYRREVTEAYAEIVRGDSRRTMLGEKKGKGAFLLRNEDIDLCYTAYDINLGTAIFTSLKLIHIMPANRLQESYLIRLIAGTKYSESLLLFMRNKIGKTSHYKHVLRLILRLFLSPLFWLAESNNWSKYLLSYRRRFRIAEQKAALEAMIKIYELQQTSRNYSG